jgi:hypothetical protein
MPTNVHYLDVALRTAPNTDIRGTTLSVIQAVDGSPIRGFDFQVRGESLGWDYDSSTDLVFLVDSEGNRVQLTRVGDFWRCVIGPRDLGGARIAPGSTGNRTCFIEVRRGTGATTTGPFTVFLSQDFTITLDRQVGVSPLSLAGCVAWYDAYDDLSTASGTAKSAIDDKAPTDRDLAQSTGVAQPKVKFDTDGAPYWEFDGSDDKMETAFSDVPGLGSGLAQTVIAVARHRSNTGTDDLLQAGGTNGVRLDYDGTNARGVSGADVASTPAGGVGAWTIYTLTKDGSEVTVRRNMVAEVSTASAGAISAGSLVVGASTANPAAYAAMDLKELLIFNTDLSAQNEELMIRALAAKHGISV